VPFRISIRIALLTWIVVVPLTTVVRGQSPSGQTVTLPTRSGAELFRAACAACHNVDGTGAPRSVVGFDTPVPDFTDCAFATVEPVADWFAIAHDGGPVRGFDRRMPAFGEALSEDEILRAIDHIHGFCEDPGWPRGELNLPRALVTEKAFPENETVLTTTVATGDSGSITNEVVYEKRFGVRNQYEVAIPFALEQSTEESWSRGLGDIALAVKRVMFHSLDAGSIVSVGGELVLPTGKETLGLGKGVTIVEPFVTFGQMLPFNGSFTRMWVRNCRRTATRLRPRRSGG
jgi:hypothetical protein